MKSFDLTFSGTILPEHDPARVKIAFAKLFSIENSAELDEIFSGKTIVLRQNLDRKTAAEFYSRIANLGGKAALVESVESNTKDHNDAGPGRKPTRGTRRGMPKHLAEDDRGTLIRPEPDRSVPDKTPTPGIPPSGHSEELDRVRKLMLRMKERSKLRYLDLQSRKAAFQRIADEELALIEQHQNDATLSEQAQLATFQAIAAKIEDQAKIEFEKLEQEQLALHALTQEKSSALEISRQEIRLRELKMLEDIDTRRESRRLTAEREIERLQQLLRDTRHEADIDDVRFIQEHEEVKSSTQQAVELLEQQHVVALDLLEQEALSLTEQLQAARARMEARSAEHDQQLQIFEQQRLKQSSALHAQQLEVRNKRDRGIAEVEKAGAQLEAMTRKTLKKLYAMELQAKRRHVAISAHNGVPGPQDTLPPIITSH